jgi:hypothetical protein
MEWLEQLLQAILDNEKGSNSTFTKGGAKVSFSNVCLPSILF